jgi:exodeoxyribonuclease V alpha subunit
VDAGAVLADVCDTSEKGSYSPDLVQRFSRIFGEELPATSIRAGRSPIDDSVVVLEKSYRFAASSALFAFSRAVQAGDAALALAHLESGGDEVVFSDADHASAGAHLVDACVAGFRAFASAPTAEAALDELARFRVLSGHREGPLGVADLNRVLEREMSCPGSSSVVVYPILVHENAPALDLFNGDVGVLVREASATRAVFRRSEGGLRSLSQSRLPRHEAAFAMSVHKSQGSEFEEVAVVLPRSGSPLLTRELLYTAVTRAKRRVLIHGTKASLREAIERPAARASGLSDALRGRSRRDA